jgi:hypothetical protein
LTTEDGGRTWVLGSLAQVTADPGEYALTIVAQGSGIENPIGNQGPTVDVAASWTVADVVSTWHNPELPPDVDGDAEVRLADLVAVVTFLRNQVLPFDLPAPTPVFGPPPMVDVDDDGKATLSDLIAVVVELRNNLEAPPAGEAEVGAKQVNPALEGSLWDFWPADPEEDWLSSLSGDVAAARRACPA